MALLQLTHVQTYQGQTMMNRYFYFTGSSVSVGLLNDCLETFELEIVPKVLRLQHNQVSDIRLDIFEIGGILFSSLGLTGVGMNADEPLPSWIALSFKLQRGNASTKSGGKRIGGISEASVIGNELWPDPTFEGWINDYCVAAGLVLTGTIGNYVPVLVKFDPDNPGTVLANQNVESVVFTKVSSQNTRKP